jgi:protease I
VEASQPLGSVTGSQFADASLTRCTADVLCANPDFLRMDQDAVGFVRSFFEEGKPVGVMCHGP